MKTYKDLSSKLIQVSEQFPHQIFSFEDQNQIIPKLLPQNGHMRTNSVEYARKNLSAFQSSPTSKSSKQTPLL